MTEDSPPDDAGTDWRRLASERNVPPAIARALWERAYAAASGDPVQAEHAFLLMLDDAEAANLTQEPGRETLTDSALGGRDASSLGPGKWTRVLLERPKPPPVAASRRGADVGKRPTADDLRNEILAASEAGKAAAAMLAASDPATIVEALRELAGSQGTGVLQKVMSVAGGAIERMLSHRPSAPPTASPAEDGTAAPADARPADAQPAESAPAETQPAKTP